MKTILLLLPLFIISCNKKTCGDFEPKLAVPRTADTLWVIPGTFFDGKKIETNKDSISAAYFSLGVFSSDKSEAYDPELPIDPSIYFRIPPFYQQTSQSELPIPDMEKLIGPFRGIEQEYRIEQLESVTITADQILWGQSIGSDLSSFFEVCEYDYIFIVKDGGYDLFPRNKKSVFPLQNLNEIKVMVPAELYIRFKTLPTERPGNIRFKVIYKIENGKQIEQISRPVTII